MSDDIGRIFKMLTDPIRATQDLYNTLPQNFHTSFIIDNVAFSGISKVHNEIQNAVFIRPFDIYVDYDR